MKNKFLRNNLKVVMAVLLVAILIAITSMAGVSALVIESVRVSPSEIAPGDAAEISMFLENNLNQDIEDVSISLDLSAVPFAPSDSSNEVTFEEIDENDDENAKFEVVALTDAESGIYKIPVKIKYTDSNEEKHEKESLISVTVNSAPILSVEIEDGLLLKGKNNEINLIVINKGLSDVQFSEIEIKRGNYYDVISKDSVYIGDIDSDDFETETFSIFFKQNSPSRINLKVELTYRDITNKQYEEDFDIELDIYNREKALELGLIQRNYTATIIAVVIVLILLYIVYRVIKKRQQRKKSNKMSEK